LADAGSLHGVLIIDKPSGPTSHDVVARTRRILHEKRIGHAGTLDPMATGVLVVLVGEGTKLAPYLTAADKRYVARIAFGIGTATLDADGAVVARAEVPPDLLEELRALAQEGRMEPAPGGRIEAALLAEAAREQQIPPAYSAIQIDGQRSHELARAGKAVELAPRPVAVRSCRVLAAAVPGLGPPSIDVEIEVSKGYYVRSFGRDLGERLGVPCHLAQLRRTRSGAFRIENAVQLDAGEAAFRAAMVPLAAAVALALPVACLTAAGIVRARQGKRLGAADFVEAPEGEVSAWLDPGGRLVAIGQRADGELVVLRGFAGA
jgi:tRNA pseudouridine55 synthase